MKDVLARRSRLQGILGVRERSVGVTAKPLICALAHRLRRVWVYVKSRVRNDGEARELAIRLRRVWVNEKRSVKTAVQHATRHPVWDEDLMLTARLQSLCSLGGNLSSDCIGRCDACLSKE